jgi:hypothetical protein
MSCFTIIFVTVAAVFWRQLVLINERVLYSHVTLSPLSRSQLQNYIPTEKERLIARTVTDIYVGVTQKVSRHPQTTWNGDSVSSEQLLDHYAITHYCHAWNPNSNEIIRKLRELFPGCDVKVWQPRNQICVSWHNPVIYEAYKTTNDKKKEAANVTV